MTRADRPPVRAVASAPRRHYVYSTVAADAARELACEPPVLAFLVAAGLLHAQVPMSPWPQWERVRFDAASVWALHDQPDVLASARAQAPVYQVPEIARASALGAVLTALDLP
jgi:hypothetical protein